MYPPHTRRLAVELLETGLSATTVSRKLGINRSTLRSWWRDRALVDKYLDHGACVRCEPLPRLPPQPQYSYLLGMYLGDGYICPVGERSKEIWSLRIALDNAWPGIIRECIDAVSIVHPGHRVSTVPSHGCTEVVARWKHWLCYFPQHGPGKKHERTIELLPWQNQIVDQYPHEFLRGLFHSDGCRVTNRVRRRINGEWKHYEYPRYFFGNCSEHILAIAQHHLDGLGVRWSFRWGKRAAPHHGRPGHLSIAEKGSVALMDSFIGPKY